MKKGFITLSTITAIAACTTTPLAVQAKGLTALTVNCGNSADQNSSAGQWIVINNEETIKDILQDLSEKCGIDLDSLFQGSCLDTPAADDAAPELPTPDETQPAPPAVTPAPDETLPPAADETQPDEAQPTPPASDETQPDETQPTPPALDETQPELPAPTPSAPETSKPEPQPPVSDTEEEDAATPESVHPYVLRIVELVNEERAKAGLNPITLDAAASNAAMIRSQEIVNSFSHTRPNGSSFSTALKEQGISYRRAGENIAWGQRSPEQVMEGWMNSSGHRANILGESFTHIGVGYYQENGVNYWTQLFYN